ncbi:hypothetical protein VPH35_116623 [Triticum aestivum]
MAPVVAPRWSTSFHDGITSGSCSTPRHTTSRPPLMLRLMLLRLMPKKRMIRFRRPRTTATMNIMIERLLGDVIVRGSSLLPGQGTRARRRRSVRWFKRR